MLQLKQNHCWNFSLLFLEIGIDFKIENIIFTNSQILIMNA